MMKSNTPLVDALSHLDDYNTSHVNASKSLKSCIWNISKARRRKGGHGVGFSYTATDIREHLRTQAFVQCHQDREPCLSEEDSSNDKQTTVQSQECFDLRFKSTASSKKREESNTSTPVKETGLRQRRGKVSNKDSVVNQWSEENFVDEEEKKMESINPIELFGALPPKELKLAQTQAKEALRLYIEAANSVVKILGLTNDEPGSSTIVKKSID
mmetsp:Transcript_14047/g.26413  ORF Transcript_14047/g.26413 Transcript_14047/m.26413 type:complete len:214 (-) Transcript_14047:854-1495(-)